MAKREESRNTTGAPRKEDLPKVKLSWKNIKKSFRLFVYIRKQKWKFLAGMFFLVGTAAVGLLLARHVRLPGDCARCTVGTQRFQEDAQSHGFSAAPRGAAAPSTTARPPTIRTRPSATRRTASG